MKKIYLTMVAMLCGVAAMAQDYQLTAADVTVPQADRLKDDGTTKNVDVPLTISLKNVDPVTSFSFQLELPDGVSVRPSTNWTLVEDRIDMEKVKYAQAAAQDEDPDDIADEDIDVGSVWNKINNKGVIAVYPVPIKFENSEGGYTYVAFAGNEGPVMNLFIRIGKDVAEGSYTVRMWDINICVGTQGQVDPKTTESTFTINVGKGTGINSINADDANAPIYNVAGQRVSKAQKGVFIQNGKKIAVK